ncbi:MAG: nucleoside monophosphate kinase [bacterium]
MKPQTIILLIGIAGSGKGTQGRQLADIKNWQWLEAGGIIRDKADEQSEQGKFIKTEINQGHALPDEVALNVVVNGLEQLCDGRALLLDGFPRSAPQYELFKQWCRLKNWPEPKAGLYLETPVSVVYPRLLARGQQTVAGQERKDDYQEAIFERLKFFVVTTMDLVDALKQEGKLVTINGDQPVENVSADINRALSNYGL